MTALYCGRTQSGMRIASHRILSPTATHVKFFNCGGEAGKCVDVEVDEVIQTLDSLLYKLTNKEGENTDRNESGLDK